MSKIEEIYLANGLKLNVFDLSRQITDDTVKVVISIQIEIDLKESYFSCLKDYNCVKSIFGDKLTYEHKIERSFIFLKNQESVREELINIFKSNSLNYLASVNFPLNLALSRLKDIKNNPYKYNKIKRKFET
ncbi:MAG: hypothetical protein A2031_02500 [Deltaproteobacteria bacterium RBG_19FT_COMBO_43_11]|nr:MAG: hypothetical protein A2031_02500 [Deltaproteobacteria bacterium RBG_19FT_COMBO_43_11]